MASRLSLPVVYSWQPQTIPKIANTALTDKLVEAVTNINGKFVRVPKLPQAYALVGADENTPLDAYSRFGRGKRYNGTNQVTSLSGTPFELAATTGEYWDEVTIAMLCVPLNTAPTLKVAVRFGAGYTTNRIMLGSRSGANSIGMRVWDNAGGGQNIETTDAAWANNTPCIVMGTRSASRSFSRLYLNGKNVIDTTHTATGAVNLTSGGWAIGGHSSTTDLYNCDIYLAALWLRAFTPADALAFGINPWQIFDAPSRPIIIGTVGGGGFSAAASAAGVATVSAVGASQATSAFSSDGVATASAVGASSAASTFTVTSAATATATSNALSAAIASSAGVAAVSATGIATANSVFTAAGAATAAATSNVTANSTFTVTGAATVSATGSSTANSVFTVAGIATAAATSLTTDSSYTVAGVAAVSGVGTSTAAAIASSAGTAAASATGTTTHAATASSAGAATASAVGIAAAYSTYSSVGAAVATGVGASRREAIAATSGLAVTLGIGASTAASIASANGIATVSAISFVPSAESIAVAAGIAACIGVGSREKIYRSKWVVY